MEFESERDVDFEDLYGDMDESRVVSTQFMVFPFNESSLQVIVMTTMLSDEEVGIRDEHNRAVKVAMLEDVDPDSDV